MKSFGFMVLAKGISRHSSVDCVMCAVLYRSIMKRSKLSKEKYKIYSVRRKGNPGSVMELSPMLTDIKP